MQRGRYFHNAKGLNPLTWFYLVANICFRALPRKCAAALNSAVEAPVRMLAKVHAGGCVSVVAVN